MANLPMRRRTLPEALAHLAEDLREHPGKYDIATLAVLLDTLAELAATETPTRVLHVTRQEGPTSELYVGFPDSADLEGWIAPRRTPRWIHVTAAPLLRPDDVV